MKVKKIYPLLNKLALTWEEYSKAHPRTKKNPNDPIFTKDQQQSSPDATKAKPSKGEAPSSTKPKETKTSPEKSTGHVKPVTEMSDEELLDKYTPKFSGSEFQRPMKIEEIEKNAGKFTGDDFAYQLINGGEKDADRVFELSSKKIGKGQRYMLSLLNKNIPKDAQDDSAGFLLDKAGSSFVGGRTLNRFLEILAKKGILSKALGEQAEKREMGSQVSSAISDPDKIKKLNIKEWHWQLKNNPHTPGDILAKIEKLYSSKEFSTYAHYRSDLFENPNYPLNNLIDKVGSPRGENDSYFWNRTDLPEEIQRGMVQSALARGRFKPPAGKVTPEQFKKLWENATKAHEDEMKGEGNYKKRKITPDKDNAYYPSSAEYELDSIAEHPDCPVEILEKILQWKQHPVNKGVGDFEQYASAITRARQAAYKSLVSKKAISDERVLAQVKKILNFDGDADFLKTMGERAFVFPEIKNADKKTFRRVSDDEIKKVRADMSKTAVHEDFDFDVTDAWVVEEETHKDYSKVAQRIGNVKQGLYHGTSYTNAGGILASGVDVGAKERTGQMFGQGFYLASQSSKAVQYASDNFSKDDGDGIVFRMDVALGDTEEMKYGRPLFDDLKSNDYDLSAAETKKRAELIKAGRAADTKWHLYHDSVTAKAGMSLDYDEYVVKDPSQIKITHIMRVKKKPKAA